jgi:hypothetical protein
MPYFIALICRSAIGKKDKLGDDVSDDSDDEQLESVSLSESKDDVSWEEVSAEQIGWDLMCESLSIVSPLAILLKIRLPLSSSSKELTVSLDQYLSHGDALIGETVSKWCINNRLTLNQMRSIGLANYESHESEDQVESPIDEFCAKIISQFKLSIDADSLLMNCGYGWIVDWSEDLETASEALPIAIDCLNSIKCSTLLLGVQSLAWSLVVGQLFASVSLLFERTSCRMPRDRVLKRDVGFSESALMPFVSFCRRFLALMMQRDSVTKISPEQQGAQREGIYPSVE